MPIIPLLRKPGPIGPAPRAVLDTERRPNVDNRAVSQAVGNLADASKIKDVDPRIYTDPIQSMGAVGEAVSRGGNILTGLAIKQAEAQTDIQVAEADQAMQDAFNKHAEFRIKTPDSTLWKANMDETLTKARQSIEGNERLRPAARDQIRIRLDKFQGDANADLIRDSAKQDFRRAGSVYDASIQRAMTARDYEGAVKLSKEAEAKGYRFPHETAGLEDNVSRSKEADQKEAEKQEREMLYTSKLTEIQADPDNVDFSDVKDPVLRDRLEVQKRQQKGMMRADAADLIDNGIATGDIKSEADIDALKLKGLSPSDAAKWKEVLKKTTNEREKEKIRANAPALAAGLDAEIRQYDPAADPDKKEYYRLIEAKALLPVGYREDLHALLKRKREGTDVKPDEVIKDMGETVISEMLTSGNLGPYKPPIPTGDAATDAEAAKQSVVARQQSNWKAASIRRAWAKELKANPKMTTAEAQSTLSRIMARPVELPALEPPSLFPTGNDSPARWDSILGPAANAPENDLPSGSKPQKPLVDYERPPLPE
jgi:hypothetical protein